MSWIVQYLLNNREHIRENLISNNTERSGQTYFMESTAVLEDEGEYSNTKNPLDDDNFNDLLIVEKAIKHLKEEGRLDDSELVILGVIEDQTFDPNVKESRNRKWAKNKKFYQLCDRIAFYLGGYFTDDGYISYMKKKYKLDEEQVETLRRFIKSEYRHKIMRKASKNGYKS